MENDREKTPLALLEQVTAALIQQQIKFSVCGGFAASFYRDRPRLTNDIDIAITGASIDAVKAAACSILESLGLKTSFGWIAGAEKSLPSPLALVIGQVSADVFDGSIDLLLPVFPWIDPAISRGQLNLIDFGFARLPTVTPEDLIIAKAFAVGIEPNRFTDLDDIQSIFRSKTELDIFHLVTEFERLQLSLPPALDSELPNALRRTVKANRQRK